MNITVNGRPLDVPEETTIASLLQDKGLDPKIVVAERNGDIVPGKHFDSTRLSEGDRLELLRFVGGG